MIGNYLKLALRNFRKNWSYSIINVSGFAIGIAATTLLLMYTWSELTFDDFHERKEQIYLVGVSQKEGANEHTGGWTTPPIGPALKEYFPQIQTTARVCLWYDEVITKREDKQYVENHVVGADSTFFNVFTADFISGNPDEALAAPNSVVITESIAKKYFGEKNPIGQTMLFESFFSECTITGVIKDWPEYSHLNIDILFSLSSLKNINFNFQNWENHTFVTYALLNKHTKPDLLEAKFPEFLSVKLGAYLEKEYAKSFDEFIGEDYYKLFLTPLKDVHLSTLVYEGKEGKKLMTYALGLIGLVIIILVCINFTNLSTSLAMDRLKEVGVRKASGGRRGALIRQFLLESILTVFLGLSIGLIMVEMALPYFNDLTNKKLSVDYLNLQFISSIIGLTIIIGIVSGIYPATYLSSFSPIRNGFVIFQFTICIFMIVGTCIIYKQLSHLTQIHLGFDKEHIIVLKRPWAMKEGLWTLKEELLKNKGVTEVSVTNTLPGRHFDGHGQHFMGDPQGKDYTIYPLMADPEILSVLNLEVVNGRGFNEDDKFKPVAMLNEASLRKYAFKDPLNMEIDAGTMGSPGKEVSIIGIVKDFHFQSFHSQIEPLIIFQTNPDQIYNINYMLIKTSGNEVQNVIGDLQQKWSDMTDNYPFEYTFLDQEFAQVFESEVITSKAYSIFSLISILIASLGLLGLAMFFAKKRNKEIGVRKVNGAKIWQVMLLLNSDFIKLVALAFIIATPIAWYAMDKWLQNFAYKTELSWWIFALAGLLAMVVALLTVSWQSWKAATRNPVEALRYE